MILARWKSILYLCLVSAFSPVWAADTIIVDRPFVKIDDVLQTDFGFADQSQPKPLETMLNLPIVDLEVGVRKTLSATEIRTLLVRRVPGLAGHLVSLNLEPRTFVFEPKQLVRAKSCFYLSRDLNVGDPISRSLVSSANYCEGALTNGLSYDSKRGTYVAREKLLAGFRLPIKSLNVLPYVANGEHLALHTQVGPVNVSRPVTVTEPIYSSGPTNVRTSDGAIVKAYYSVDHEVQQ